MIELFTHILFTLLKLCKPAGVKSLVAANIALRQQLITLSRIRNRAPSLTFIGNINDGLWSRGAGPIDFFKCESISLTTHTVMAVIDQFSRQIIGFAIHAGDPSRIDTCRMFNSIISGKSKLPKYLSSDNDPPFKFHRWHANLRILEIEEIKSIPYIPESHPFIERLFRTVRNEFLDQTLFWGKQNLQIKLNSFKDYYNDTRGHWGLGQRTPSQQRQTGQKPKIIVEPIADHWQSHCSGLFHTPIAA